MTLNKLQEKFLRSLAHALKPVIRVGQNGLTENVKDEIKNALEYHELVKIKINVGDRDAKAECIEQIQQLSKANLIQKIGNTATFYRRHPKKPKIELPRR
ncbi:MAG: ribosome assembly RNA-binding protein YhbY [Gammaproteobacteria bacterium]|nr:ribosome assembly RNA-binding protein YhbY [Gammaproteobacteria bacterium]